MNNDYFKNTMKDVQSISPILDSMVNLSLETGLEPAGLNLPNAWRRCERLVREYGQADEKAKELGYTSLAFALKALAQFKRNQTEGMQTLPEQFHTVPQIWTRGRCDIGNQEGFKPLSFSAAQREHRQVLQLLLEAWPLADESDRDGMLIAYLSTSAEQFKQELYDFLYRADNSLEEQLLMEIGEREKEYKFERWSAENENARATGRKSKRK